MKEIVIIKVISFHYSKTDALSGCSIGMSVCCGLSSALLYASKDLRPVKSLILVDIIQVDRTAPEMKVLPR